MKTFFSAWFIMLSGLLCAQNFQRIHGKVVEKYGQFPLEGVNLTIEEAGAGAVTNSDGTFEISQVPTGRFSVRFSMVGFDTLLLDNVELIAGKQLVLHVEMLASVVNLKEISVKGRQTHANNYNSMVLVSGRQFSIEETKRFAGSLNDVQRMATSFAGVKSQDDRVNDVIVRGNMPSGVLFRLDGLNIPNPNHWAMPGSAGGTISMLNNNVLKNSDFLTGAFAAEYDAFSGVFDLRSRNGNTIKHESIAQIGFNGLEVGAEGPIGRRQRASYLTNYRKSFLGLLSGMMKSTIGDAVPNYDDLFIKFNLPTDRYGSFSLLGIGGRSKIHMKPENQSIPGYVEEDLRSGSNTGIVALTHQYGWAPGMFSNTALMISDVTMKNDIDYVWVSDAGLPIREPYLTGRFKDGRMSLSHFTQSAIGKRNVVKAGFYLDFLRSGYRQDVSEDLGEAEPVRHLDFHGKYGQLHAYLNYLWRLNQDMEMIWGLAHKYLTLTKKGVIEPKWSLRYRQGVKGTWSMGAGLYSKAPSLLHIATVRDSGFMSDRLPNKNLKHMKAFHAVAGYDHFFTSKFHLRSELYVQYLYNLITGGVTGDGRSGTFSAVNEFSFAFEEMPSLLTNRGRGRNYGIEITVEQFMTKGLYYLATVSVFNSRYQAADGLWRNTRFNSNLIANFTGGKEFRLGQKFRFLIDVRATFSRGSRYTPLDEAESRERQRAVFDYGNAYAAQHPHYFRSDLRLGLKQDGNKISHEWAFEAQNITNRRNVFGQEYDRNANTLKRQYQTGFLPVGLYRIYF